MVLGKKAEHGNIDPKHTTTALKTLHTSSYDTIVQEQSISTVCFALVTMLKN